MIRIVVVGEGLAAFPVGEFTDHYVKLQFPPPGAGYEAPFDPKEIKSTRPKSEWHRQRTYTVRAFDQETNRLTIDFVVHGDRGLAGPWALNAKPGGVLQLIGPGGAYAPEAGAPWHLMIGDEAAIPAIAASLSRVPAGVPVKALLEVEDEGDVVELGSPGRLDLSWIKRRGAGRSPSLLLDAVATAELPGSHGQVFLHGEAGMVRVVRRHLILDRGLPKESLSATGYWKQTRTEEGWREDKPEWKRQVELDADGKRAG